MRREREEQRQKELAEGVIKSIREYDEIMKRAFDKISNMEVEMERERKVSGTGHSSTQGHKEDEDVLNEALRRVKEQDVAKKVEERKRKLKEEAEKEEARRADEKRMRWERMMWEDKQRAKALKEKREREARELKQRQAVWAAYLARREKEEEEKKREKKELFERVAAEARAIREEKEEEEKKRKAMAKAKAKGPCLSE
jgi:hypothetical protein